ncbi:MAG: RNB domain-containing ribonuclease [Bacilli bacterium]|nr:RNB domain-containing ribonuclease [Bacilli bacterium]
MFETVRNNFNEVFVKSKVTLPYVYAKFSVSSLNEFFEFLSKYINDDFEYIISNEEYFKNINYLILDILNKTNNKEDMYALRSLINNIIKTCKNYLKPYNKKEKKKDALFSKCNNLKDILTFDLEQIDFILNDEEEKNMNLKVIKGLIFDIKYPDYLFRLVQLNPNIVNMINSDGVSLFKSVCDYYLDNIYTMSNEDIKYFKRVITLFLESDLLTIKNDELKSIIDRCNTLNKIKPNNSIDFLNKSLKRHFPNLAGTDKYNCLSYTKMKTPIDIVTKESGSRIDLRDVFTITIDGLRNKRLDNMLFDDCFSITGSGNDLHILVSVPDVDLIIDRDSEIDNFMRSLGQSVYQKGYKKALLDYKFAKSVSLEKGKDRNALTFDINVDSEGNIKGIDFYESIVKVNYNLVKDDADTYIKYGTNDERLKVLNKMNDLARKLCHNRKETYGGKTPGKLIMDEFNILPNLQTAKFCEENGILFPYKNFLGELKKNSRKHIIKVKEFKEKNELDEESNELLNSIFYIYNRIFYDTINYGNNLYHNAPYGSVGNPMREYMSLETDRLIKDIIIHCINQEYWQERIERDCIEYTETSAKIKELYDIKRGR